MSRFDKYLAIPFKEGGRDASGADCFGLYCLVVAGEADVLIDHPSTMADGLRSVRRAFADALASGAWEEVQSPQTFDAVLLAAYVGPARAVSRAEVHVGCVIDGSVLHTEAHCGPRLQRLDDPEIAYRIRGFYRPAVLVDHAA